MCSDIDDMLMDDVMHDVETRVSKKDFALAFQAMNAKAKQLEAELKKKEASLAAQSNGAELCKVLYKEEKKQLVAKTAKLEAECETLKMKHDKLKTELENLRNTLRNMHAKGQPTGQDLSNSLTGVNTPVKRPADDGLRITESEVPITPCFLFKDNPEGLQPMKVPPPCHNGTPIKMAKMEQVETETEKMFAFEGRPILKMGDLDKNAPTRWLEPVEVVVCPVETREWKSFFRVHVGPLQWMKKRDPSGQIRLFKKTITGEPHVFDEITKDWMDLLNYKNLLRDRKRKAAVKPPWR